MESAGTSTESRAGVVYAVLAYTSWGVVPAYWKQLLEVPAMELLAHRVVWTLLLVGALLAATGRLGELRATLRSGPRFGALALSSALIGINWGVFLWAMLNERLLETSLGYYLSPLMNVLLGSVFLGERLTRGAWLAVALAACGVAVLAAGSGGLPAVSLVLAGSFGLYGLVRKVAPVRPVVGLAVETALMTPLAVGYLWLLVGENGAGVARFVDGPLDISLLLVGSGLVTAFPLLNFAAAARRLWLTTLGLFQYIGPSLTFALAIGVYGEPFAVRQGAAFALIWTALAIYSADALSQSRRATPRRPSSATDAAPRPEPPPRA